MKEIKEADKKKMRKTQRRGEEVNMLINLRTKREKKINGLET